mmetsp:Transcript_11658/g.36990  ORF Transcript_11658/g.36990 Transcript_11658/m.36990 type:complete len:260 (+) Transcript_11658:768-1547(+)
MLRPQRPLAHGARRERCDGGICRALVFCYQNRLLGGDVGVECASIGLLAGLGGHAALPFHDTLPGGGDGRDGPLVDGVHERPREGAEHGPAEHGIPHHLGTGAVEDPLGEPLQAGHELGPHLAGGDLLEPLQLLLVVDGAHQGEAVTVRKERADRVADLVLIGHRSPRPRHWLQGGLQIVAGGDGTAFVLQVEVEVPEEPEEAGREAAEFGVGGLPTGAGTDVLCHLCHEREAVQGGLVDTTHLVVHEPAKGDGRGVKT